MRSISALGVTGCGNPDLTGACLRSYLANTDAFGRRVDLMVLDDTAGEGARAMRAMTEVIARERGQPVTVVGRAERARLVDELSRRLSIPSETLAFGLLGRWRAEDVRTLGANRNGYLLATAGQMATMFDDDTVCATYQMTDIVPKIALKTSATWADYWFFADRSLAFARARRVELDVLGAHEQLLGRRAADVIEPATVERPLDGMDAATRASLAAGGEVAFTIMGSIGDSAVWAPQYLMMEGANRERLTETRESYQTANTSREVIRTAPHPLITPNIACMAMAMGIDNRTLLAPFFPLFRNSDGVFSSCLRACRPSAFSGCVPQAIAHLPPGERSHAPLAVHEVPGTYRVSDLIRIALLSAGQLLVTASPAERLSAIGARLGELSREKPAEFTARFLFLMKAAWRLLAQRMSASLDRHRSLPDYWAGDISRAIQHLESQARSAQSLCPWELKGDPNPVLSLQELLRLYGDFLTAWPAIWDLAARGHLAETLSISATVGMPPASRKAS